MSEGSELETEHAELGPQRSLAAERTRRHRDRKRKGLRMARVEIFEHEIDGLVLYGYLAPGDRADPLALKEALEKLVETTVAPRVTKK